mgnify:CR=1 FL=1
MAEQPKSGIASLADRAKNMFRRVVEYPDPSVVMADQVDPNITPQTYSDLYKGSVAGAVSIPGEIGAALKPAIPVLPKTGSLAPVRLASEVLQQFPTTEETTQFAVDKGLITRETAESPDYFAGQFFSPLPAGAIAATVKGAKVLSKFGPQAGRYISQEGPTTTTKIKAYHGSPHEFDIFDSSKIGTGEGAQNFGHGLYFGGEPEVGENYKAMAKLRPSPLPPEKGSLAYDMEMEHGYGEYLPDEVDELIRSEIDPYAIETFTNSSGTKTFYEFEDGSGYEFDSELMTLTPSGERNGYLYEVELDVKPEELIDHDVPIGEQPDSLKDKIKNLTKELIPTKADAEEISNYLKDYPTDSVLFKPDVEGGMFVDQLEWLLSHRAGKDEPYELTRKRVPREAAKLLSKHGIKGLKYKPGRFLPTGKIPETAKPNYVIYDDNLVNILKTLGVLGGIGVPLLMDNTAGPYASGYAFAEGGFVEKLKKLGSDIINYPDPNIVMADQATADIPEAFKDPRTYIEAEKGAVAGTLGLPGDIGSMSEGVADYIQYMPTFLRAPVQTLMQLPTTEDVKEFGIEKGLLTREETEGVPFQVGEFLSPGSGVAAVKGAKVLSKFGPQAGKYLSQEGLLAAERLIPDMFQSRLNIVPKGPTTTTKATTSFRTVDPEGFYSVVQEAIPLINRGKGTGQEFVDEMRSVAVKQGYPVKSFNNEIKAMSLDLGSEFTKEDFVQHLNDNRFTVNVVENKPSELPSDESVFFNETETIGYDDLSVGNRDFFEEDIKTEQRDLLRSGLEEDLSGEYSLSPKLDREAAFNKAAILKAFDEDKTEFIDVDGNTQDFEDKIDSIVYDIAKENYEQPYQVYQRVPVVIDGDEQFTLFRGGEDMPWELREGDGMDGENVARRPNGEAVVSEYNLAEAQVQTRLHLEEQGFVSFEGDGLGYMDEFALTDRVNVDGTQPNRREILITSPEVGDFKDHFTRTDDTVVSSVMASDWDGPIATTRGDLPASNKVLYGDEIQSDLAMANSRWGQRTKIIEADVLPLLDDLRYLSDELKKFESNKLAPVTQSEEIIDKSVKDIILGTEGVSRFDKSMTPLQVSNIVLILKDRLQTISNDPSLYGVFSKNPRLNSILYGENRLSDNLTSAREKLNQIKGPETNVPNPWQDTWHELALKKFMKTAVDEGYDYVMVPKSETLVAKWGEGAVEGREGAYRKMYQTVYDRKIPSFLKKYAKQYNSELIDAELGESGVSDLYKGMSVPETTLIKITPEMKKAVKEGQPLFNIAVGTAAGAGALSTLDKEESEDTFAQGGVVRKRGIGTLNEIARTMFQQPRGVSGLSSVARNMFQ